MREAPQRPLMRSRGKGKQLPFDKQPVLFVSAENLRSRRAVEKIGGILEASPDAEGRLVYRISASALA